MAYTNAMLYADEILYEVRNVLWKIKERGGMAPKSLIESEMQRLQGQYNGTIINVALMAIGKRQQYVSKLSEAQLQSLVVRAKQQNGDLVAEIAKLRAAKESAQGGTN